MQELTQALQSGEALSDREIQQATVALLDESMPHGEKADFLAALATKGETASEIAGFASEFLNHAVEPGLDRNRINKPLLDVCGTGGDKLNLFNVSTTSVFLLAAAGVAVVKHGNRGITSKSGGADALEALGIRIDLPPEDFGRCIEEVGAGFLFAPMYHPAFKAVVPVRQLLAQRGQRTIFNILGPLLNPVRPDYQLIGIFDGSLGPAFADILGRLGRKRAWAVHGSAGDAGGMDELSTLGETLVWETIENEEGVPTRVDSIIQPSSLGIESPSLEELQGGEAAENAELITGILEGTIRGAKRDIVTLNCAAGLVITGLEPELRAGLAQANEILDSGSALETLRRWQNFS
ncbi:MAG: anthranilate phosphoribosyltransferase [Verrucomicrobiales bacterium]|nr:anthranilate phosphoribosyltransferase [Verrucomicrobiales bacterium]